MEVSENYLAMGGSSFIREVAIPVGDMVSQLSEKYPSNTEINLELNQRPQACISALDGIICVFVMLSGWFGKKVLDDVYGEVFQPTIKQNIHKYINSKSEKNFKKYSLSLCLRTRDSNTSILICCTGSSIEEIEKSESRIESVLNISESYIKPQNENFEVILINIDNGKLKTQPETFSSYSDAINALKNHYPVKPLTVFSNRKTHRK